MDRADTIDYLLDVTSVATVSLLNPTPLFVNCYDSRPNEDLATFSGVVLL